MVGLKVEALLRAVKMVRESQEKLEKGQERMEERLMEKQMIIHRQLAVVEEMSSSSDVRLNRMEGKSANQFRNLRRDVREIRRMLAVLLQDEHASQSGLRAHSSDSEYHCVNSQ